MRERESQLPSDLDAVRRNVAQLHQERERIGLLTEPAGASSLTVALLTLTADVTA